MPRSSSPVTQRNQPARENRQTEPTRAIPTSNSPVILRNQPNREHVQGEPTRA